MVTDTVTVPKGITLTIEPGTVVKFKHCRDYKGFCHRIGLIIQGGVLKAIGTPEQQIWFTSDAKDPINGDWETIWISDSKNENIIKYAIIENDNVIKESPKIIDADGKYLIPGLIDSHVHIESSYMIPTTLAPLLINRGTTTIVADPHEITSVLDIKGMLYMFEEAKRTMLKIYFTNKDC